jgi:hypothetical protein
MVKRRGQGGYRIGKILRSKNLNLLALRSTEKFFLTSLFVELIEQAPGEQTVLTSENAGL